MSPLRFIKATIGRPTRQHVASGIAGAAIALAVIGSAAGIKDLVTGGASVQTAASRSGALAAAQNAKALVPFLGPFARNHKGYAQCGPAVRLMEGALRNTKPPLRIAKAKDCIGLATEFQLRRFQARHHIPPSGIYGKRTHDALAHAYTPRQVIDLVSLARQKSEALKRSTILIVTSHAYAERRLMGYCNFGHLSFCTLRGQWPAWPDVPRHTDCSGYVQWVYFQAGIPNPNGFGVGNTHSLVLRGTPVSINGPLKVGDLIFYHSNNSHVAIYIGHGLVSSHGRAGIDIYPFGKHDIYAIHRYF